MTAKAVSGSPPDSEQQQRQNVRLFIGRDLIEGGHRGISGLDQFRLIRREC